MAEKYVDISAAAGGDGSFSTPWNDLLDLFANAPSNGTLDAGDIVYIRTADANGDLGQTLLSSVTMLERSTYDYPIIWVFDAGEKWTEHGQFTISINDASALLLSQHNLWRGYNKSGRIYCDYTGGTDFMQTKRRNIFYDIELEIGPGAGTNGYFVLPSDGLCAFLNCLIDIKRPLNKLLFSRTNYNNNLLIGGTYFDLNGISFNYPILYSKGIGNRFFINGGGFLNPGAVVPPLWIDNFEAAYYETLVESDGFDFNGHTFEDYTPSNSASCRYHYYMGNYSLDSSLDFYQATVPGQVMWQSGSSFPTLNATLPDGTPWSMQCRNGNSDCCHITNPYVDNVIEVYNDTEGIKKVTVELLIADQIANKTDRDFFLEVAYFDAAKTAQWGSTRTNISPNALTTSLAAWSSLVYEGKNYSRYKLEYTTELAAQAESVIEVVIGSGVSRVSFDDYYFVCPDVQIEGV